MLQGHHVVLRKLASDTVRLVSGQHLRILIGESLLHGVRRCRPSLNPSTSVQSVEVLNLQQLAARQLEYSTVCVLDGAEELAGRDLVLAEALVDWRWGALAHLGNWACSHLLGPAERRVVDIVRQWGSIGDWLPVVGYVGWILSGL